MWTVSVGCTVRVEHAREVLKPRSVCYFNLHGFWFGVRQIKEKRLKRTKIIESKPFELQAATENQEACDITPEEDEKCKTGIL